MVQIIAMTEISGEGSRTMILIIKRRIKRGGGRW